MRRGELFDLAETLAEAWANGGGTGIIDQIERHPPMLAATLATAIALELDKLFMEGAAFRAALAERAFREPARPRVKMVCSECGSQNALRDAWAEWDVDAQEWVLGTVFDFNLCGDCEAEKCIEEMPLDAEEADASAGG